jgi:hypothetical protein
LSPKSGVCFPARWWFVVCFSPQRWVQWRFLLRPRRARAAAMPGISGGLATFNGRHRRADTPDALDTLEGDEPSSGEGSDDDSEYSGSGGGGGGGSGGEGGQRGTVIIQLEHDGRTARIALPQALQVDQFTRLVYAALQVERKDDAVELVGLEARGGLTLPVSLVCRCPSILASAGTLNFRLLVRSTVDAAQTRTAVSRAAAKAKRAAAASVEPPSSSHERRVAKLVEFAAILHRHDHLSAADVRRIEHVLLRHADLAGVLVRVYWADLDSDRLLHVLQYLAGCTEDEVQLTRDIIDVTNLIAGPDGAGLAEVVLLNLFYLILTGDERLRKSFQVPMLLVVAVVVAVVVVVVVLVVGAAAWRRVTQRACPNAD